MGHDLEQNCSAVAFPKEPTTDSRRSSLWTQGARHAAALPGKRKISRREMDAERFVLAEARAKV